MTCLILLVIIAVALALAAGIYATGGDVAGTMRTGWRWLKRRVGR